jgi:poly(3-hydroxybutyrate) depolymerase
MWSPIAFVLLVIAACGGRENASLERRSSGAIGAAGTGSRSGSSAGTSTGSNSAGASSGAGAMSGTLGVMSSGTGASGEATSGSMALGSGASSGTVVVIPGADGGADRGPVAGTPVPSPGCGKPWAGMTGMWISQPAGCAQGNDNQGTAQCQAIPQGATVPPKATQGSPEYRGWWVYVPTGYDPNMPYRVIFTGAGCGDGNYFNAGEDGYAYYSLDNGNAILVGLDYDTYSDVPGCYDDRDPQSNDFTFFPWLQNQVENELCVDTSHEFFSGFSSGAWVAQQLNCAFPDKLRGFAAVSGCEPGALGYPGAQYSPCVDKPTAAFYVHDFDDTDNTYACILPGCARVLRQNGCTTAAGTPYTVCNPLDTTTTTAYAIPPSIAVPLGTDCVTFNGCPAKYPVVFCVVHGTEHTDDSSYAAPLFWDWMSNKLAD